MHDFVVVGAGPAGSRFARGAAQAGHDVVVCEAGAVGSPLACSGHVSRDLWSYTDDGAREDLLQNEIVGARFHADGPGSPSHRFYRRRPISNVIDRVGLDRHLADRAREAGATVLTDHAVTDVTETADGVIVEVRPGDTEPDAAAGAATAAADRTDATEGGTTTFRGRMVVGCDGPTSRVRRALGIAEPDDILHGVLGFDPTPDHGDHVDVFLDVPGFFAWRIPRGDAGVEYGLAAAPDRDVRDRFDALCEAHGVTVDRRCSGAIPIGPPKRITSDRGFLIGDAAAQTKPFTGGGILYGMTAADHAVEAIAPDDPRTLAEYERAWRADLGREIRLGHLLRRAYDLPRPVRAAGLRLLAGRVGVHMDRPTSVLSRDHLRAMVR